MQVTKTGLVIIDEASMVDNELMKYIDHCITGKVIFVGDSTQLPPINHHVSPVFNSGFSTYKLTDVVRQKEGNLLSLISDLRHAVETNGDIPSIEIDDKEIIHLPRNQFLKVLHEDMTSPNWVSNTSRYITYTNSDVIKINNMIASSINGSQLIRKGDILTNNCYIYRNGPTESYSVPTDMEIFVKNVMEGTKTVNGQVFEGTYVEYDYITFFVPKKYSDFNLLMELDCGCVADFRHIYASTIHKAQGSTFETVYININNLKKALKRGTFPFIQLLYVAVSRASKRVIFTGDL